MCFNWVSTKEMADGSVFELVRGVLGPVDKLLDYVFYAGVFYGARNVARLVIRACCGIRTYCVPIGRASNEDISKKYGKWAVITGGTTGIGLAYAHEVSSNLIGEGYYYECTFPLVCPKASERGVDQ